MDNGIDYDGALDSEKYFATNREEQPVIANRGINVSGFPSLLSSPNAYWQRLNCSVVCVLNWMTLTLPFS